MLQLYLVVAQLLLLAGVQESLLQLPLEPPQAPDVVVASDYKDRADVNLSEIRPRLSVQYKWDCECRHSKCLNAGWCFIIRFKSFAEHSRLQLLNSNEAT